MEHIGHSRFFESTAQQNKFLRKFKTKITTQQQIDFWNTDMPVSYYDFFFLESQDQADLTPFIVDIPKEEWEERNSFLLENYKELITDFKHKRLLLDLEELNSSFDEKLNNTFNKKELLQRERERIDSSFVPLSLPVGGLVGGNTASVSFLNQTFHASYSSYNDYMKYDKEPTYSEVHYYVKHVVSEANGFTLAKYKKRLDRILANLENIEVQDLRENILQLQDQLIQKGKKRFSEPVIVLKAHYSKQLDHIYSSPLPVKEKARLVADTLGIGQENGEKYMRGIGAKSSKTYKADYYQILVDYFDELGWKEKKDECQQVLLKIKAESPN